MKEFVRANIKSTLTIERLAIMNQAPTIPGISGLEEFGRSTLVVGYKGEAAGVATIVEVLLSDTEENRR